MTDSHTELTPSSRAKPVALNPVTGSFVDAALESEFLAEDIELSVKRFVRFSIPLSTVVFLAYGLHDAWVIPSVRVAAWSIRYGIFGPVAALVLFVIFSRHLAQWHQPAMLAFGVALNTVVFWIGAISPPAGYFIYTSYAVAFTTLGPFVARMNVVTQAAYTAITIALFTAFDLGLAHSGLAVGLSMALTLLAMGGIGTIIAYKLERQARESFLQRRLIRDQIEQLDLERGKSDALLLNILPAQIAARLKAGDGAIADRFTDVTVLFADIVGFTKMSLRLTPVELVHRLNAVFSAFDDLADELEIEKIKTIGDAYMAVSGLSGQPNHASAMAEMALGIQARMKEFSAAFGETLDVRIGLNTGAVVAGVIGKKKFIYDVWGDTVNTASRMESHSLPGAIQVTEETNERLKSDYLLEERGEIAVKGKGHMKTYFLSGRRASQGDGG